MGNRSRDASSIGCGARGGHKWGVNAAKALGGWQIAMGRQEEPAETAARMAGEQLVECEGIVRAVDPDLLGRELENLKVDELRRSASPAIKSRSASIGPGYLHCLGGEEKRLMFRLWALIFAYLHEHDPSGEGEPDLDELRQFATRYETLWQTDPKGVNPEGEALLKHPMLPAMLRQAATDDPDTILLRFLRARKWRLPDAFVMMMECLYWRHSFNVESLVEQGEAGINRKLLEGGKCYAWGEDREGRIVCYVRARLHDKHAQSLEDSMAYTVWCLETGRLLRRHDEQLLTVVIDLKGAGLAAFDLAYVQFTLRCLQDYYPESLGACLIMNAPWIFWAFWATVKPFLDPVVASKISFIKEAELPDYVHPEQIPRDFAPGQCPFIYDYASYLEMDPGPSQDNDGDRQAPDDNECDGGEMGREFVRLTIAMGRQLEGDPVDLHTLQQLTAERNRLKSELRCRCYDRLARALPTNMFHRWGVLDRRGYVSWESYTPPPATLERPSSGGSQKSQSSSAGSRR